MTASPAAEPATTAAPRRAARTARTTAAAPLLALVVLLLALDRLHAFAPSARPGRLGSLPGRIGRPNGRSAPASSLASSPPAAEPYDLVVIGGGSAGLTAAKFASTFGKSVCLVEAGKLGGDCTWTGCVPSKTLLARAKRAKIWREMQREYGGGGGEVDDASLRRMLNGVKRDIDANRREIYERDDGPERDIDANRREIYERDDGPEVLREAGIDVAIGRASFVDAKTVEVAGPAAEASDGVRRLTAKFGIVVATGAAPRDFASDIEGLDGVPHWTYENVWDEFFAYVEATEGRKKVTDARIVVAGGGPVGCELSQALSRLGCDVTLVSSSERLLPDAEEEASLALREAFEDEGMRVVCGRRVASVAEEGECGSLLATLDSGEVITGDRILVAAGRAPNTSGMNLSAIGVRIDPETNGIMTNSELETAARGVYAAGDCTGDRQFTHYAGFQGAIAARNALLPLADAGVSGDVPAATFTDPEVASFGLTQSAAEAEYGEDAVSVSYRRLERVDRAVCEGADKRGFLKVVYRTRSKKIVGATIVAPAAGELISELAVAREGGVGFDKLSTVMHAYPSYSIALQQMAADVYYDKLRKNRALYDFLKKVGL
ncbi:hypothetical protein ACHAWF_010143 [Thalassiosira exigua]